ncbi:hypothetical protein EUGRSUZ_A00439 [Eucalyptus grandis]|uniref:Uncharacterized protein n=2 Tax=Eucalyptus grandis TaxID=71139 RepID=A0ACC3M0B0_EUCGR|nr:hypothetical protein EUGRSUZ_A00439 [Eucalyptus grandis]
MLNPCSLGSRSPGAEARRRSLEFRVQTASTATTTYGPSPLHSRYVEHKFIFHIRPDVHCVEQRLRIIISV